MKEIPLTQGKFAQIDDEDFETISQYRWVAAKYKRSFYAVTKIKDDHGVWRNHKMHRIVLGIQNPKVFIDHRNGDGLCNIRSNIRICTPSENGKNRRVGNNSTSGLKGVHWVPGVKKWRARIMLNYIRHNIGYFETKELAGIAYDEYAKTMHGHFANLNFDSAAIDV